MTDPPTSDASDPPSALSSPPPPDDPEQGWWVHWRSWRDPFPGLLLFTAVRPASWLTLLLLGSIAYWGCFLASAGLDRLGGRSGTVAPSRQRSIAPDSVAGVPSVWAAFAGALGAAEFRPDAEAVDLFLSPAYAVVAERSGAPSGPAAEGRSRDRGFWWTLLHRLVHLAIWTIPAGLALRYSVLTVAGRDRTGLAATGLLAAKRGLNLMAVVLIPLIAIGLASLFFLVPGWISTGSRVGVVTAETLSLVAVPLALAAGLFAFGSLFAVPLGWAAVMTEPDGDPINALSRGYEYTFRRPFHLIGYLLLAWLISRVLLFFANGICAAALVLSQRFFVLANGSDASPAGMSLLHAYLMHLPAVFAALLFWTLSGGLYLLMRRATNGQEIEEIGEY